jgi:hypothetical protein
MTMQEITTLLQPALVYPNCAVRQARLTQMVQALLLQGDPTTERVAYIVRGLWVEQDEDNAVAVGARMVRHAQPST